MEIITGSYQPGLVSLSLFIAIVASYTALELARYIGESNENQRLIWLISGAGAMGLGIWSMHFIAMLAFSLPVKVSYDPSITAVSLLIAIVASALALYLVSGLSMSRRRWLWGGVLMGLGIATMHYTGMVAMRMEGNMEFDPVLLMTSVLVAIIVSLVALYLAFNLRNRNRRFHTQLKLTSAVVMGIAIVGMHYTGMAATQFFVAPGTTLMEMQLTSSQAWLSAAIAIVNIIVLGSALVVTMFNQEVVQRLFDSNNIFSRYWMLWCALFYLAAFFFIEAIIQTSLSKEHSSYGLLNHFLSSDNNELLNHAGIFVTAIVFATIGQRMFTLSKKLTDELTTMRNHLEDTVEVRTAELEESEYRVRGVLESTSDAFVATNSNWRIIDWNPAAQVMFGLERLEVIGHSLNDRLFPNTETNSFPPQFQTSIDQQKQDDTIYELLATRGNGITFPVEINLSSMSLGSSFVNNLFIRDISERKQAEKTLLEAKKLAEEASKTKSEFLANMSHELRTPLNAILGFSEILKDGLIGELNEEQVDYIREINDSGKHLLSLINDILDLSKIEAGKMELHLEDVDISLLLSNSLSIVKEKANTHGVKLELDLDEKLGSIQVDERKFKQIVYNLLSNAVKFTPKGGRIGIQSRLENDALQVTVWDTGIGISNEDQDLLFQPFQQLDGAHSRKFEGTGLGLSLARRLAALHDGDITLDSIVGEGSRFTVSLPYCRTEQQTVEASPEQVLEQPQGEVNIQNPLVLLIEDNEYAAALMMAQLKNTHYRTLWTRSGEEGLDLANQTNPGLVLLDILLPGMNGWEVLQQLKSSPKTSNIPVLVVSIVADTKRGLSLGALETLEKPVNREQLFAAVRRATQIQAAGQHSCRVMVVDDDSRARNMVRTQLEDQGYNVECVEGGLDAIDRIHENPPDLVILDLMMPDVTGFDVLMDMRQKADTLHIPVIIVSAKMLSENEKLFLQQHTTEVISKTDFDSEALLNSIKVTLQDADVNSIHF